MTKDTINIILSAVGTGIILIGVPIALYNLQVIRRTHHLQSVTQFMSYLSSTTKDREFIYRKFSFTEGLMLSEEAKKCAENVINSLNQIGLLIENKLLSPELVLSICHTVIVRCWYKLEAYVKYQERLIGGRYGRRVERLANRAKAFHDIRSHQRCHQLFITDGTGQSKLIYKTSIKGGFSGCWQQIVWFIKRMFHAY